MERTDRALPGTHGAWSAYACAQFRCLEDAGGRPTLLPESLGINWHIYRPIIITSLRKHAPGVIRSRGVCVHRFFAFNFVVIEEEGFCHGMALRASRPRYTDEVIELHSTMNRFGISEDL